METAEVSKQDVSNLVQTTETPVEKHKKKKKDKRRKEEKQNHVDAEQRVSPDNVETTKYKSHKKKKEHKHKHRRREEDKAANGEKTDYALVAGTMERAEEVGKKKTKTENDIRIQESEKSQAIKIERNELSEVKKEKKKKHRSKREHHHRHHHHQKDKKTAQNGEYGKEREAYVQNTSLPVPPEQQGSEYSRPAKFVPNEKMREISLEHTVPAERDFHGNRGERVQVVQTLNHTDPYSIQSSKSSNYITAFQKDQSQLSSRQLDPASISTFQSDNRAQYKVEQWKEQNRSPPSLKRREEYSESHWQQNLNNQAVGGGQHSTDNTTQSLGYQPIEEAPLPQSPTKAAPQQSYRGDAPHEMVQRTVPDSPVQHDWQRPQPSQLPAEITQRSLVEGNWQPPPPPMQQPWPIQPPAENVQKSPPRVESRPSWQPIKSPPQFESGPNWQPTQSTQMFPTPAQQPHPSRPPLDNINPFSRVEEDKPQHHRPPPLQQQIGPMTPSYESPELEHKAVNKSLDESVDSPRYHHEYWRFDSTHEETPPDQSTHFRTSLAQERSDYPSPQQSPQQPREVRSPYQKSSSGTSDSDSSSSSDSSDSDSSTSSSSSDSDSSPPPSHHHRSSLHQPWEKYQLSRDGQYRPDQPPALGYSYEEYDKMGKDPGHRGIPLRNDTASHYPQQSQGPRTDHQTLSRPYPIQPQYYEGNFQQPFNRDSADQYSKTPAKQQNASSSFCTLL